MNRIRELIIEREPFSKFYVTCSECEEELFTIEDHEPERHLRNEALLLYRMADHRRETGHTTVHSQIQPAAVLERIDVQITVNNDV